MNEKQINDNLLMLKYFIQEEADENWQDYCEAIQGLLDLYNSEKEKNKKLEENSIHFMDCDSKELMRNNQELAKINKRLISDNEALRKEINNDYVCKKFIKEKISKLENESKPLYEKEFTSVDEDWVLHNNRRKIEVLEELLEEGN